MPYHSLLTAYKSLLPWNLSRTKCFVSMVLGVIISGSVQQHKMSLGFTEDSKPESTCARIRDFLRSFAFNFEDYSRAIVSMTPLKGPFSLALDRTNWKFGALNINLLVLAVVITDKFALPILWKALSKTGNSNSAERVDLLRTFLKVFGENCISCLTVDREFVGKAWIDYLIEHKIPFYIRIKENRLVEWGKGERNIADFFSHLSPREIRHIQFQMKGEKLYFAGTRSKNGELVVVMSNRSKGKKILKIYKQRWTIELMFRHCKSNAFGLEDTHLIHLNRIEKLLAVVVSALLFCFLKGTEVEKCSPTPYKKTIASKAVSTFRRGFDVLRKTIIHMRNEALQFMLQVVTGQEK